MPPTSQATGTEDTDDRLGRAALAFLSPRPAPATARDEELLRQGRRLALRSGLAATAWGEGPPVLLAHGWESRGTHWRAFIAGLVEAGFRAIAVDARAHGDSPGERTTVLEFGLALVDAGREVGPLVGIVGHSFGAGAVGIAIGRGLDAERAGLISGPASLVAVVERWGRTHGLAEEEVPAFVRRVEGHLGEPIAGLDVARMLAGFGRPVLVVHDRGDDEVPVDDGLATASGYPGAEVLITERHGHRRILLARPVVRAVVDFLKAGLGSSA